MELKWTSNGLRLNPKETHKTNIYKNKSTGGWVFHCPRPRAPQSTDFATIQSIQFHFVSMDALYLSKISNLTYSTMRCCHKKHKVVCINTHMLKMSPGDPHTIFLVTSFTRKMPESSDFMYSSIFMLENIWYHHFTRSGQNSQNLVPNTCPWRPKLNWSKIHNFLWIWSTLGKIMISCDI